MGANAVTEYGKFANFQDLSGSSLPDADSQDGALYYSQGSFHMNKALTANAVTASYAKIDYLDVREINSQAVTETTLEVVDKLIIAGSGSASAAVDGGGLQLGGTNDGNAVASLLWDHTNSAIDFNIGSTTEMRLQNGALLPQTDDDLDLGSSALKWQDLYLDGVAYVDDIHAADCDINGGAIDGTTIGAASAAAGTFLAVAGTTATFSSTLTANGDVDLGNATTDTITATGRFDSDLVPSTDDARDLGASALKWKDLYLDGVAYVDDIHAADCDINGGAIDGTTIGAASAAAGTFLAVAGTTATFSGLASLDGGINVNDSLTVSTAGAVAGATSIDGSGDLTMGTITMSGFSVDADGDTAVKSLQATDMTVNGGIAFSNNSGQFSESESLVWNGSNAVVVAGYVSSSLGLRTGGTLEVESHTLLDNTLTVLSGAILQHTLSVAGATTLNGAVTLGNASGDDITNTGRWVGDFVPKVDSSIDLGTSALQFAEAHIDTGHIDTVTAVNVDGILGANTPAAATVTTLNTSAAVNLNLVTDATNSTSGALIVDGGVGIAKKLYVGTDLDVEGTANLDAVDIDGTVQIDNTVTVGVDDTGYDVKFFGDTASRYFLWDTSTNGIGIGQACESGYAIDVKTGHGNVRADAFVTYSDRTLKTNIQTMDNCLEKVMKLEPTTYDKIATGKSEIGFIAQDVAKVVPEVCALDANGEGRGIDYSRMSTLLVGALKAQQDQIAQLKAVVAKLQK